MFHVKDKVVCVDDHSYTIHPQPHIHKLRKGRVYVVSHVLHGVWPPHPVFGETSYGILLKGVDSGADSYHPARFMPAENTTPEPKLLEL